MSNEMNLTHRADAYFRALSSGNLSATGLTFAGFSYVNGSAPRVCTMLVAPMRHPGRAAETATTTTAGEAAGNITSFASLNFAWSEARPRAAAAFSHSSVPFFPCPPPVVFLIRRLLLKNPAAPHHPFLLAQLFVNTVQAFCRMEILLKSYGASNINFSTSSQPIPGDTSTPVNSALFTILVEGKGAEDVGWGDRREPPSRLKARFRREVPLSIGGVQFAFEVLPTEACLASYLTDTPRQIAVGSAFLLFAVACVAVFYDVVSRRYLRKVVHEHIVSCDARVRAEEARVKAEAATAEARHRLVSTGAPPRRAGGRGTTTGKSLLIDVPRVHCRYRG